MPKVDRGAAIAVPSLEETLQKVKAVLLPSIESHANNEEFSRKDGLDFLDVKNNILLSYLIDLVTYIRDKNRGEVDERNFDRLTEMKVVLDKMRGLDKKLRYQIEKLLASSSTATTFAAGGSNLEDPLQFRPNPKALDDEDDSNEEDSDSDDDENNDYGASGSDEYGEQTGAAADEDIDDDLKAARATLSLAKEKKRRDDDDNDDGVYRAPRLTAVPYNLDQEHKAKEKEKRARRRMRATELAQTLRDQYGEVPEQEDTHGGSDYGKQRAAARRLAEREAEKTKYEEATMVRLQTSRKDKKEKKRLMREEGSNLNAIADLGNLVRESRAFGRDMDSDDDERTPSLPVEKGRYDNGKRRREPVNLDRRSGQRRGKISKAKNALQAALYNTEGKSKKKRSKR